MAVWILNRVALALHRRQLAEHGGAPGFDLVRLSMALGWPKTVAHFAPRHVTFHDLAAAYADGVLRLRPFESGNERTAYLLANLFLLLNGAAPPASRQERLAVFTAFAAGAIRRPQYAQWMSMRRLAERSGAGTVVGVRRDARGRLVGVGLLRAAPKRDGARRARSLPAPALPAVPLLKD
jgi:death-on-curing protein